jgi:hypothetical protein
MTMSTRTNTAFIAPVILLLLGTGAAVWLVTTPWYMRDDRAIEAAGQATPVGTPQIGVESNDE